MTEEIDLSFEAFKRLVPHLRGSLWWGANWDKPVVNKTEMAMVDDYCLIHQL